MDNILDSHLRAYQGDLPYDFDNIIQLEWYPGRIIQYAQQGAESLLELGLGYGITTNIFSEYFKKHVVLDGSPVVIEHFKKNYPDCTAKIIETYFEKFESDEKFDLIVMGYVLEHVDNPGVILRHFKKFLTPSGRIFITVPNAEALNRRLGHLAGMLPDMCVLSDNDLLLGHKRYYTVKTLTEEIENSGLCLEKMEGVYLKPFTTQQIVSLNFDKRIIDALCQVGVKYPELSCGMLARVKLC